MKRIIIFVATTAFALMACSKPETDTGCGDLSFERLTATVQEATRSTSTDYFVVTVSSATATVGQWKYCELPQTVSLKQGAYSVSVTSSEVQAAVSREGCYKGDAEFTIESGKTTTLDPIVCSLQSIKVSVAYGGEIAQALGDDCVATVSLGDAALAFASDDTEPGYFKPIASSNTLTLSFDGTVDGYKEHLAAEIADVKAGQWRKITIKMTYIDGRRTLSAEIAPWTADDDMNIQ